MLVAPGGDRAARRAPHGADDGLGGVAVAVAGGVAGLYLSYYARHRGRRLGRRVDRARCTSPALPWRSSRRAATRVIGQAPAQEAKPSWADRARRALSGAGHRAGGRAPAVIERLASQRCALTAHELDEGLRGQGERVGLASVYRVLEQLAALGRCRAWRSAPARPGSSRAQSGQHHHHVVCERCGKVL